MIQTNSTWATHMTFPPSTTTTKNSIALTVASIKSGQPNNKSGGMKKQEATFSRPLVVAEPVERKNVVEKLKHKSTRATAMHRKKTPNDPLNPTTCPSIRLTANAAPGLTAAG